jgi:hypothetical protein
MKFAQYTGTARQYIREYLDPDGTLQYGPTSEEEMRLLWSDLEKIFAADGGTGISEEDFVKAVADMQDEHGPG